MKKFFLITISIILAVFFWLFQPFSSFSEERLSSQPERVTVVYVTVTGDPQCTKLYKLDSWQDNKPIASKEPVLLALPERLPSPEDGDYAYADNVFELTGFRYQFQESNRLTGSVAVRPSNRFDLVAWTIVTPYKRWKTVTTDPNDPFETSNQPLDFSVEEGGFEPEDFTKVNSIDCLN
ncbi:hypothetical protein KJY73_10910 [Bowmanella sp. Y26]|uniref:hypothetical protein n=1 Tax=Bowmanella yangjiangensis TaxID=2811230 RepID=UPI001BDC2C2E|nr:hypothetical protein [Bowmanella yangjiangensis]MBT1064087.1 hypothetical protein [Bowmanella yangjiangensis]